MSENDDLGVEQPAQGPGEDEQTEAGSDSDGVVEAESAPVAEQGETLAEAQARADENWDKFLRASAELENARRRGDRDLQNARKFALEKFATELLGVRDSLELGVQAAGAGDADVTRLREGSEMTLRLLTATLEKFGIRELDPEGEPFDPEFHEAMSMQESAEAEPDSVLKVVQKGYVLNERLLRPARVIVARASQSETG